jgi:hypothetical protein
MIEQTSKSKLGNQKIVFLYALIGTLIVFNIGIFMGYMLESSRIEKINQMYAETEMKILDQITQSESVELLDFDCSSLIKENINFGDSIFEEALQIQKYEDANIFSEEIVSQHRRFDLLRTLFWINSIKIKEKCNSDYHNIVYFYQYNEPTIDQKARQKFLSNLLSELKEKYGNEIMLIPISADNNIPSVNLLVEKYNITGLPVILVDEKFLVTDVNSLEDVEKYLN